MFLLQIHVHLSMADAINSVLIHRRTKKSAIAPRASFLTLTTPPALIVSVCCTFFKVLLIAIVGESTISKKLRKCFTNESEKAAKRGGATTSR